MKNKGFTLVELIAVIVILGLISLIAIPTVNNSIIKYKDKLEADAIKNIEQAAKNWAADNINKLPNSVYDKSEGATNLYMTYPDIDTEQDFSELKIKLSNLQNTGYIDSTVKNPKDNKEFCTTATVTIRKTNTGYTYVADKDALTGPC